MSDVTIDTLRLDIVVDNANSTRTLNSMRKALENFSAVVDKLDISKLNQIANAFEKIGTSISSGIQQGVQQVDKLNKSLQTTASAMKRVGTETPTDKAAGKITSGIKLGTIVGKLVWIRNTTKQLGQSLAGLVQNGIAFTETLNMWQVAMKDNTAEARTFVATMNQAYGVSEQMLMEYQGTFKNMLSALGSIGDSSAYSLSEALTNMALDFSSLYNVSIEDAMTKFQAVLSGQVRPIRSVSGYDITENTIFDLYQQMGGQKSVRQLSQLEKRLLRIYAVFQQMASTNALGDLQKTLTNNANQLRIMSSVAEEFGMWIGNAVSYLMQESGILVNINSLLIAGREIAKSWAYSLGYREENFASGLFEDVTDVNEGVDELQGKLLGFDKFNVLGDATSEAGDVDIESSLLDAISNYNSLLNGFENPAVTKATEILEKLGYSMVYYVGEGAESMRLTKEEFEELYGTIENANDLGVSVRTVYELNEGLGSLADTLKVLGSAILGVGTVISAVSIGTKIASWAKSEKTIAGLTKALGLLKKAFSPLGIVIMVVVAALAYMYTTNEEFRNSVNKLFSALVSLIGSALEPIKTILDAIIPVIAKCLEVLAKILTPIINAITYVIELADQMGFLEGAVWLLIGALGTAGLIYIISEAIMKFSELKTASEGVKTALQNLGTGIKKWITSPTTVAIAGVALLVANVGALISSWDDMSAWERAVGIIGAVAGAIMLVVAAIAAFHGTWSLGTAVAAITAALVAAGAAIAVYASQAKKTSADMSNIAGYARGGGFNTADLFYAGENGRTELIASSNNGRGGAVMNMEQLETAVAAGVRSGMQGYQPTTYGGVRVVMDKTTVGKMVSNSSSTENSRVGRR